MQVKINNIDRDYTLGQNPIFDAIILPFLSNNESNKFLSQNPNFAKFYIFNNKKDNKTQFLKDIHRNPILLNEMKLIDSIEALQADDWFSSEQIEYITRFHQGLILYPQTVISDMYNYFHIPKPNGNIYHNYTIENSKIFYSASLHFSHNKSIYTDSTSYFQIIYIIEIDLENFKVNAINTTLKNNIIKDSKLKTDIDLLGNYIYSVDQWWNEHSSSSIESSCGKSAGFNNKENITNEILIKQLTQEIYTSAKSPEIYFPIIFSYLYLDDIALEEKTNKFVRELLTKIGDNQSKNNKYLSLNISFEINNKTYINNININWFFYEQKINLAASSIGQGCNITESAFLYWVLENKLSKTTLNEAKAKQLYSQYFLDHNISSNHFINLHEKIGKDLNQDQSFEFNEQHTQNADISVEKIKYYKLKYSFTDAIQEDNQPLEGDIKRSAFHKQIIANKYTKNKYNTKNEIIQERPTLRTKIKEEIIDTIADNNVEHIFLSYRETIVDGKSIVYIDKTNDHAKLDLKNNEICYGETIRETTTRPDKLNNITKDNKGKAYRKIDITNEILKVKNNYEDEFTLVEEADKTGEIRESQVSLEAAQYNTPEQKRTNLFQNKFEPMLNNKQIQQKTNIDSFNTQKYQVLISPEDEYSVKSNISSIENNNFNAVKNIVTHPSGIITNTNNKTIFDHTHHAKRSNSWPNTKRDIKEATFDINLLSDSLVNPESYHDDSEYYEIRNIINIIDSELKTKKKFIMIKYQKKDIKAETSDNKYGNLEKEINRIIHPAPDPNRDTFQKNHDQCTLFGEQTRGNGFNIKREDLKENFVNTETWQSHQLILDLAKNGNCYQTATKLKYQLDQLNIPATLAFRYIDDEEKFGHAFVITNKLTIQPYLIATLTAEHNLVNNMLQLDYSNYPSTANVNHSLMMLYSPSGETASINIFGIVDKIASETSFLIKVYTTTQKINHDLKQYFQSPQDIHISIDIATDICMICNLTGVIEYIKISSLSLYLRSDLLHSTVALYKGNYAYSIFKFEQATLTTAKLATTLTIASFTSWPIATLAVMFAQYSYNKLKYDAEIYNNSHHLDENALKTGLYSVQDYFEFNHPTLGEYIFS